MQIVFIGSGRLASNLAPALFAAGHQIKQVYSRTKEAAQLLADKVGAKATNMLDEVDRDADVFIFSVTDTVLASLVCELSKGRENILFLHTAGSISLSVFGEKKHCGVFYPMQTFSKGRKVDFQRIPVFIEGKDTNSLEQIRKLASDVSASVYELSSENRKYLHLAAVFACNFSNHCYALAAKILERHGVSFDVMLPLIEETAEKVHELCPVEAQTGPAIRYDENVMNAHMKLLADDPLVSKVYEVMSNSIHDLSVKRK